MLYEAGKDVVPTASLGDASLGDEVTQSGSPRSAVPYWGRKSSVVPYWVDASKTSRSFLTLSPLKRGRFYHSSTASVKRKRPIGLTQVSRCFRSNCFDSGLSDPTEIDGRVHVSIVDAAAFGACPFPDVQGFTFAYVSAVRAALRRWKPPIPLHQGLAVPLCLVFKLAHELTPRGIADSLRQRTVLHWSSTRCSCPCSKSGFGSCWLPS